jgi:hypothetical protein
VSDLACAEIDDLLGLGGHVLAQTDDRADLLAVFRVRDADHAYVENFRVPIEVLLHLARVHVLATANNHVLQAAHDVAEALRVEHRQISGMHPSGGVNGLGRALRIAPVASHDAVTPGT